MGLLGFIKDVALLPVEAGLDVAGISVVDAVVKDKDQPFRTIDRISSALNNLDETLDK
jgi:hypothetical protein